MATIVNARDVLLQAANPRVAGVTQTNLTVDQSQVTGLGLVLTGVKRITTLASGQVFLIPTSGSPSPSSITLAVTVSNFAAVPTVSVLSGTLSPIPNAIDGVFTIPVASLSASAVLRISATDTSVTPNVTYTDDITILRQVEGNTSVVGFLTQEDITLTADAAGNVSSYYGANGNFKVYQGTNDITSLCTFALLANPSGVSYTINASTGAYAIVAGMPSATNSTTITFRATFGATTLDKVMTIQKSKTVALSSGTNGSDGQRGSRTFYVALSGSTATFSDSLATTTASVDGGPVRGDLVTQYNNSQNFSLSKFWDGTAWQILNAVVDGNLLVTGTVGTNALSANSVTTAKIAAQTITTDKLVVTGVGEALNPDPNTQDASEWTGTFTLVADGAAPNGRAIEVSSSAQVNVISNRLVPVNVNKNYLIRINAKQVSGATTCYLGVSFCDSSGNNIDGGTSSVAGTWTTPGTYFYYGLRGTAPTGSYVEYSTSFGPNEASLIPTGATFMRVVVLANYSGGTGVQRFSSPRIIEKTTGALVVDGTITAAKIDTKNLTIKDSAGNIVFAAGTQLNGSNLLMNGNFKATTSGPRPQGYNYYNGAGISVTGSAATGVKGGTAAYSLLANASSSQNFGIFTTTSIVDGATQGGVQGGWKANATYMVTFKARKVNGAGWTAMGLGWNTSPATTVNVSNPNLTTSYQQYAFRITWGGSVEAIGGLYVSILGNTVSGDQIIIDELQVQETTVINDWQPSSREALNAGNPITSSNVSTYIGNAAIDTAQINKLQTTNYAEDGSGNPTAGARLASSGTAIKVASGSLQVGSVFFTDYWYRLINGIDGSVAAGGVLWRGNNDASTRSGAPNIACLSVQADGSTVTNSNTQHVTHRFKITPTAYANRTDNLDAMTQLHVQYFSSTTAASPFDEAYFPCPSRTYDGASGIAQGHWYKQWRYSGTNSVSATAQPLESNGLYTGYLRIRYANTYGWSATQDFGPNSTRLSDLPTATITGVAGSSSSGGGAVGGFCPAPWVKIRLAGGTEVEASQLYNGAKLESVDDETLVPKIGTVNYLQTVWQPRLRLKLTNGQVTEWSEHHRFAVVDRGWVEIENLLPGDHIVGLSEAVVESVIFVGEAPVISFLVEGAGTYFGGGLLCHNIKSQLP